MHSAQTDGFRSALQSAATRCNAYVVAARAPAADDPASDRGEIVAHGHMPSPRHAHSGACRQRPRRRRAARGLRRRRRRVRLPVGDVRHIPARHEGSRGLPPRTPADSSERGVSDPPLRKGCQRLAQRRRAAAGCSVRVAAGRMARCSWPSGCRTPEQPVTTCPQCAQTFHRVCCGVEDGWDYCVGCTAIRERAFALGAVGGASDAHATTPAARVGGSAAADAGAGAPEARRGRSRWSRAARSSRSPSSASCGCRTRPCCSPSAAASRWRSSPQRSADDASPRYRPARSLI